MRPPPADFQFTHSRNIFSRFTHSRKFFLKFTQLRFSENRGKFLEKSGNFLESGKHSLLETRLFDSCIDGLLITLNGQCILAQPTSLAMAFDQAKLKHHAFHTE